MKWIIFSLMLLSGLSHAAIKKPVINPSWSTTDEAHPIDSIYTRMGIKSGDVIKAINGDPVKSAESFADMVRAYNAGNVCIVYERKKKLRKVCLTRSNISESVVDTPLDETTSQ